MRTKLRGPLNVPQVLCRGGSADQRSPPCRGERECCPKLMPGLLRASVIAAARFIIPTPGTLIVVDGASTGQYGVTAISGELQWKRHSRILTCAPVPGASTWMAGVFVLIAFGGFTPTYCAPVVNGTFHAPPIAHIHGFLPVSCQFSSQVRRPG